MRYQILEYRRNLARSKRVLIEESLFEALMDYVPTIQDEMAVPTFPELASARDAIRPAIPAPQSEARQSCHADALCPHPPAVNEKVSGGVARRPFDRFVRPCESFAYLAGESGLPPLR